MKITPIVTNFAKNYRSPIYKSLLENAGDATMHNSLNPLPYFPYMHSPAQGKNWGQQLSPICRQ